MRTLATIREIGEIRPIEGADLIELAVVDGWKCVIKRGDFSVGQRVVYCEIDSFLPVRPEFEFLRKSSWKKMGEQEGFRLRTIKLRGQISQGLLLPLDVVGQGVELHDDVTELLGITKYEPPVPTCLAGEIHGPFPGSIQKTDEERIQNLADSYDSFRQLEFWVSEKLDGTSMTVFLDQGEFGVCGRNWRYKPTPGNSLWQIAERDGLETKLRGANRNLAFQGELIGPGIQGNPYKLSELGWFVFNVFDIDATEYLPKPDVNELCQSLGIQQVPFVGKQKVPSTMDEILLLAEGKSQLNAATEREGLVWVATTDRDRVSFKTISNGFLAREE